MLQLRSVLSLCVLALGILAGGARTGHAAPTAPVLARELCTALATAVDATATGDGPLFIASYRPGPKEREVPLALHSTAFTYDNALAIIALVACGDTDRARRIGAAFVHALDNDRSFRDGRLRNAYRAGAVRTNEAALLPGWWDAAAGRWAEDPYQDGSATGNVAWVALAFLTLHQATGDSDDLAAARRALDWIESRTRAAGGVGFTGGLYGYDPAQVRLGWASTEHNVDIAAAAGWHARISGEARMADMAKAARGFLDAALAGDIGCFVLGTVPASPGSDLAAGPLPLGPMADAGHLALDTQLWPHLLLDAAPAWSPTLGCVERRFAVQDGYDFDNDRDGLWVEGTAQAALTFQATGHPARAAELLAGLRAHRAVGGWLLATPAARLTTGLTIGPDSRTPDFFYFNRPHLGATAWAALAALGWNPFTGRHAR
ncbi:MAG TPA: hypothetical protein VHP59_33870 [Vineibacter terrae]|nr:hypothetical protein [Vineibacter terrae]HEX2891480.1 hypothetical protein [Vineibacter terrae]